MNYLYRSPLKCPDPECGFQAEDTTAFNIHKLLVHTEIVKEGRLEMEKSKAKAKKRR